MKLRMPSLATSSLLALVLGLAGGFLAQWLHSAPLLAVASWAKPIGTVWIDAIRMTVIPIVLTSLILAIAGGSDGRAVGRLGVLSAAVFVALLLLGGIVTALVVPPILHAFPPGSLSLGGARTPAPTAVTSGEVSFVDWLVGSVPVNPFKAAADGDLLPLLVFTVPFALALTRIAPDSRRSVIAMTRGVSEALFVMLRWFLRVAPLAVFCLAWDLTARTGVAGLGAVGAFVAIVSLLLIGCTLALYPIAVGVGRVSLGRFARAVREAQILGASTRSSLAALPALMRGIERHLAFPSVVTAFVTPLASATFRMNRTPSSTAKLLFLAYVYGVRLDPLHVAAFIAIVTLVSFTTPGVPSAGSIATLPVYLSFGIPLEGVVILNAVDAIPDIFKTVTNVTAHGAATAAVARLSGVGAEAAAAVPAALVVEES